LQEGLASIHWEQGPVQPVRVPNYGASMGRQRTPLVRCPYFTLEYIQDTEPFTCGGDGRLQALLVLHGRGRLSTAGGDEALQLGQTWLLPAALTQARCRPEGHLGLLLCTLE